MRAIEQERELIWNVKRQKRSTHIACVVRNGRVRWGQTFWASHATKAMPDGARVYLLTWCQRNGGFPILDLDLAYIDVAKRVA